MLKWFERGGPRKSDIAQFDFAGCVINAYARRILISRALIPKDEFTEEENRWIDRFPWLHASGPMMLWPLPNVWPGVSIEDEPNADRMSVLMRIPAAVRFVSYEPALGEVNWKRWLGYGYKTPTGEWKRYIDWVIVGGESGPGARPFNIEWARQTIEQCKAARVACFMKQFGARPYELKPYGIDCIGEPDNWPGVTKFVDTSVIYAHSRVKVYPRLKDRKGGSPEEWPEWARVRESPAPTREKSSFLKSQAAPYISHMRTTSGVRHEA